MLTQIAKVDRSGRITLPQQALDALGLSPDGEVILEMTESEIVIKPRAQAHPITERISSMLLPVAEWEEMEKEIDPLAYS
jgi:AbrB family looped-hinge helix DNA binding protein